MNHYYDCDGGGYFVEVIIYSAIGFLPDRINITLDGAPFQTETWTTPTSYLFGPFPLASLIGIEITNAAEVACDWSTSIQLPTCEGPGFGSFATVSVLGFDVLFDVMVGEPQFVTLRSVGSFGLGGVTTIDAGVGYPLDGSPIQQRYCFYGSDEDGNPLDTLTDIYLNQQYITEIDVTGLCWLGTLDVGKNLLISLDMSGNPNLAVITADANLITSFIWPPGPTKIIYVSFENNTGLVVVPQLSPSLIDEACNIGFSGCALDQASVDMLITACYDSGALNGFLSMTGGTNAPLPVSGPVFDLLTDLITIRGWTVSGN